MSETAAIHPDTSSPRAAVEARGSSHERRPERAAVTIVGGGIAGLAAAWQLSELGARDIVLLEAEPLLATHASGRNAAIFLPLEESLSAVWLATRSRNLLDERIGTSWLSVRGVALLSAERDALDELKFTASRLGLFHERWSSPQIGQRLPLLTGGECQEALFLPLGGVVDTHLVLMRMRAWLRRAGVTLLTDTRAASLEVERGRTTGVCLEDGTRIASERVVLAAGAWGAALAAPTGSTLALKPLRRHLVQLAGVGLPDWRHPVAWRIDDPVYFRPEAGGVLASPCDETPCLPGVPGSDPAALEELGARMSRFAPKLAERVTVQRSWACIRTMTEDRELAVGPDSKIKGLYWCAGLGGRGITCGTAAGELLARVLLGLSHPLARVLSPERFG